MDITNVNDLSALFLEYSSLKFGTQAILEIYQECFMDAPH